MNPFFLDEFQEELDRSEIEAQRAGAPIVAMKLGEVFGKIVPAGKVTLEDLLEENL